jgi:transposase
MDAPARKPYPSDLTDAQWAILEPLLLAFEARVRPGPPREVDLREVMNALLYQNRTGCQWAFLPHDLLPKSTVYEYFAKYRDHHVWPQIVDALRVAVRERTPKAPGQEGMREPTPSAVCVVLLCDFILGGQSLGAAGRDASGVAGISPSLHTSGRSVPPPSAATWHSPSARFPPHSAAVAVSP